MNETQNPAFEDALRNFQLELIALCLDTVGTDIDTICIYCCNEKIVTSFNLFTMIGNNVRTLSQLDLDQEVISSCLGNGSLRLFELSTICKKYDAPQPTEMRIVYAVKSETFQVEYKYKPALKGSSLPGDVFHQWIEDIRHPKEAKPKKSAGKKLLAPKKVWEYKQSGLREVMVSETAALNANELTYFLEYKKDSFYESQLKRFNLHSQEEKVLFTERHVIRDLGLSESGRRYFTSFSRKLYCLDDTTGEIIWATEAGRFNASWDIVMDEQNIYMHNGRIYCINKVSGEIVWESSEDIKDAGSPIAITDEYICCGTSGGSILCLDKNSGKLVWTYGENLYAKNGFLLSDDVFFVTASDKGFGKLFLLNATSGDLISETDMELECSRTPLLDGNVMYVGNNMGEMKCFEISPEYELTEKFSYLADSSISTQAILEGDSLWFATEKGYLYGIDRHTGEEIAKKKKVGGNPRWISIYENGLLILSHKGQIEYYQK